MKLIVASVLRPMLYYQVMQRCKARYLICNFEQELKLLVSSKPDHFPFRI